MNELIRFARPVEAPFKVGPDSEAMPVITEALRIAEALVFAAKAPLPLDEIASKLPPDLDPESVMEELRRLYSARGVNLVRRAGGFAFRTAPDLAYLLAKEDA